MRLRENTVPEQKATALEPAVSHRRARGTNGVVACTRQSEGRLLINRSSPLWGTGDYASLRSETVFLWKK